MAESEQSKIKILIADDHPPFAQGLSKLLEEQPDLAPVGIARDGEEAVRLVHDLKPDVVVMDVTMPKMNGIDATRMVKQEFPNTTVLVLSAYGYHSYVLSALEAGAGGYLLKDVPLRELISAIRGLCAGEMVFEQRVAEKLLRSLAKPTGDVHVKDGLSPMELEVLKMGARGLSNKKIGEELFISERTVQSHFTSIFQKLEVGSRIEAMLRALKEGWLSVNDIP